MEHGAVDVYDCNTNVASEDAIDCKELAKKLEMESSDSKHNEFRRTCNKAGNLSHSKCKLEKKINDSICEGFNITREQRGINGNGVESNEEM